MHICASFECSMKDAPTGFCMHSIPVEAPFCYLVATRLVMTGGMQFMYR